MPFTKKILIVFVSCTMLVMVAQANAQGVFGGKTFGQRLDDFGRTIFGTGASDEKDPQAQPNTQPTPQKTNSDVATSDTAKPRAGSIIKVPGTSNESGNSSSSAPVDRGDRYHPAPQSNVRYSAPAESSPAPAQPYRPLLGTSLLDGESPDATATKPRQTTDRAGQSTVGSGRVVMPGRQTSPPAQVTEFGPAPSQPIQNRLMQSRTSAFKNPASEQRSAESDESPIGADSAPRTANNTGRYQSERQASVPSTPMPRAANQPVPTNQPKAPGQPTLARRPGVSEQPGRPIIAQRTMPNVHTDNSGAGVKSSQVDAAPNPARTANSAVNAKDEGLLITRRGPVLSVETLGPRKIIVGKESTYEVVLLNSGEVAAEELVVFVSLPEWAEVAGAEASRGTPQFMTPGQSGAPFQWKVGRLEAKAKEKLSLRIIPRQSKPFDLAVRWDYKPVVSQTMIEVQEPKLEMRLEGPRDVFYGKKESYRLKMMNTGTGNAEGVIVNLMSIGSGENVPATYQLGVLPAGESKTIEIELTARQAGELNIQVEAKGDAGIHAELAEKVLVRRAGLEIVAEGSKLQFVGSTCTYIIRVKNPGNAPAMNIRLAATLPPGVKYISGVEGIRADATSGKLHWILDSLNPQLEQVYALKCRLGAVGTARMEIAAVAEDELSTAAGVSTQVDAAASLFLDVQDPAGPVSLGEESIYEVRVRNRGTKDAENIEVLGYFSRGIEPTGAEGGPNRIGPGQVAFSPIAVLAPGAEAVFKVHAKAETAGNHVFRAEVHCKTTGTRLVSEKNTLYYQDSITQDAPDANAPIEANRNLLTPENYRTQRR